MNGDGNVVTMCGNIVNLDEYSMKLLKEIAEETDTAIVEVLVRAIRKEYWVSKAQLRGDKIIFKSKKHGMREVFMD